MTCIQVISQFTPSSLSKHLQSQIANSHTHAHTAHNERPFCFLSQNNRDPLPIPRNSTTNHSNHHTLDDKSRTILEPFQPKIQNIETE